MENTFESVCVYSYSFFFFDGKDAHQYKPVALSTTLSRRAHSQTSSVSDANHMRRYRRTTRAGANGENRRSERLQKNDVEAPRVALQNARMRHRVNLLAKL